MAQAYLTKAEIPVPDWDGCRFGFGQDVVSEVWKSVFLEVERRGSDWVVTKIDRRKTPLDQSEQGLVVMHLSEAASGLLRA